MFSHKKGGLRKSKKAAGASPSTLFIFLTLLIVMYVLLVPPAYREELLNDDNNDSDDDVTGYDKIFLDKNPGHWSYMSVSKYDHDLSSFNLLSKKEAKEIVKTNYLESKITAFSRKIGTLTFNISDMKKIDNIYLNYKAISLSGAVDISVNGKVVKPIISTGEDVVGIDKSYVLPGNNLVEFIPRSVGFAFWNTNGVKMDKAVIYADLTDDSGLYSSQKIWIDTEELKQMEDGFFRFYVDCNPAEMGRIEILLNSNKIFSGVPDCSILNMIDHITPHILRIGDNEIEFRATNGRFIFDNLLFQTNMKDSVYPTYYFTVENEDYKILQTGLVDMNLTFTFVNNDDYKEINAVLNGHNIGVNTRDRVYSVKVNPVLDIKEGNNVLELRPKSTIDIVNVKLRALFE